MKILIVSPTPTHPSSAGNRARGVDPAGSLGFIEVGADDGVAHGVGGNLGQELLDPLLNDSALSLGESSHRCIDAVPFGLADLRGMGEVAAAVIAAALTGPPIPLCANGLDSRFDAIVEVLQVLLRVAHGVGPR